MAMNTPDVDWIRAALPGDVDRLVVAFSGGIDSTVLLHLAMQTNLPVSAVHVHHGLQSAADDWAAHCERFCDNRGIPIHIEKVDVKVDGAGLEAAAREARLAVFARLMTSGACLLTGHHADDQAETVLLRMLRGTGPDGLSGMRACRRFGDGWLARPLLGSTRAQIAAIASRAGLQWIEDPSNARCTQDRNYLRQRVMPALSQRWPRASSTLARLAGLAGEQRVVLEDLLVEKIRDICADETGPLALEPVTDMQAPMQAAVLRAWIMQAGMRPPSQRRLSSGLHALLSARGDRTPILEWSDGQVIRHGAWLYRLPGAPPAVTEPQRWPLQVSPTLDWQGALGWVSCASDDKAVPPALRDEVLQVRRPQPGERVDLVGRPSKLITEYAREAGVVPWWRSELPVVETAAGEVLAVGVLGLTAAGAARVDIDEWRLHWQMGAGAAPGDWAYVCKPVPKGD